MDHEPNLDLAPVHGCCDRVDQEGHVVVDDLDDRMGTAPAMGLGRGVVDPDLGPARFAILGEGPDRPGGAGQVFWCLVAQVVRRYVGEEKPQKPFGRRRRLPIFVARLVAGDPLADQLRRRIDQGGRRVFRETCHDRCSFPARCRNAARRCQLFYLVIYSEISEVEACLGARKRPSPRLLHRLGERERLPKESFWSPSAARLGQAFRIFGLRRRCETGAWS